MLIHLQNKNQLQLEFVNREFHWHISSGFRFCKNKFKQNLCIKSNWMWQGPAKCILGLCKLIFCVQPKGKLASQDLFFSLYGVGWVSPLPQHPSPLPDSTEDTPQGVGLLYGAGEGWEQHRPPLTPCRSQCSPRPAPCCSGHAPPFRRDSGNSCGHRKHWHQVSIWGESRKSQSQCRGKGVL